MLAACRHDIPLRLVNIEGTGEKLEYAQRLLINIMEDPVCPDKLVCNSLI
jgi:hypothetical protein